MENSIFSNYNLLQGYNVNRGPSAQDEEGVESEAGNKAEKEKKVRTSFTKNQIAMLEQRFASQKYLTSVERTSLAEKLNMSDAQVKTWFQNRRTKWSSRRHESELRKQQRLTMARLLTSEYTGAYERK
ncbi:hypothetical protein Q1695_001039 [Nippostrongylus brasiliensis]|nr:hypothetical protein Q1695_001039 [Nippostrongylus brasiliensis]